MTTDSYDPTLAALEILDAFYCPQRSPEATTTIRRLLDTYGPGGELMEVLASQDVLPMGMAEPDQTARVFYIPAEQPEAWIEAADFEQEESDLFNRFEPQRVTMMPPQIRWKANFTVRCLSPEVAGRLAGTGWLDSISFTPARRGAMAPSDAKHVLVRGMRIINDSREGELFRSWLQAGTPLAVYKHGLRELNPEGVGPFPPTAADAEAWCSDVPGVILVEQQVAELREAMGCPQQPIQWQTLTRADLARIFPRRRPNGIFPQAVPSAEERAALVTKWAPLMGSVQQSPQMQERMAMLLENQANELQGQGKGESGLGLIEKALTRFIRLLTSTVLAGDVAALTGFLRTYHSDQGDVPIELLRYPLAILGAGYALIDPFGAGGPVVAFPGPSEPPRPLSPKIEARP